MSLFSSRPAFTKSPRASLSGVMFVALGVVFLSADFITARTHTLRVVRVIQQNVEATTAPPPLRRMSLVEQTKINSADNPKQRARFTLELADLRLTQAEQSTAARDYARASVELGAYQALIDDAHNHVKNQSAFDKARDVYKRFDLKLRSHVTRLETLRRTTPSAYAVHIETTAALTRRVRTVMLNMYFGSNVVNDEPPAEVDEDRANDTSGNENARQPPSQP